MISEESAGAIVFRKEDGKVFFLLLHYPTSAKSKKEFWDLPKGHMEGDEDELSTVRREVEEETGLKDLDFVEGFRQGIKYYFQFQEKKVFKTVIFLLAETKTKEITISHEHVGFKWLTFAEACHQLTYKNAKEILRKANDLINRKFSNGL